MVTIGSIMGTYRSLLMCLQHFPDSLVKDVFISCYAWNSIKEQYQYLRELYTEYDSVHERQKDPNKQEQVKYIINTYSCIIGQWNTNSSIQNIFSVDKLKRELNFTFEIKKDQYEKHPPKLDLVDIPSYGDVMSMESFIRACESGGFIDYDGDGNPIVEDKMVQNIDISPSDIMHGIYRKEFKKIIWFNK